MYTAAIRLDALAYRSDPESTHLPYAHLQLASLFDHSSCTM
jgi:hypothetical protein